MNVNENQVEIVLFQLKLGPKLVVPLVSEVPESILKRRPATGVWSAHEHACHLPAVQPLMMQRLGYMLTETSPTITSYEPAKDDPDDALLNVDLKEQMDRFTRERAKMVDQLRSLELDQWQITANHEEYSHYSVFIMFRHLAMHDLYHAYRIEQRLLKKEWGDG